MLPILVTLLITTPILVLGVWLYLHRHRFAPSVRSVLAIAVYLFIFLGGPVIYVLWKRKGVAAELAVGGDASGVKMLHNLVVLWLAGVIGIGAELLRKLRRREKK